MTWRGVNTTTQEDCAVSDATDEIESGMARLIDVINDLDAAIGEWRDATGCDDPEEARQNIEILKAVSQ